MVDVSLDNVTLVGRWLDFGRVQRRVQEWAKEDAVEFLDLETGEMMPGKVSCRELAVRGFPDADGGFQRAMVVDGAHVSNWCRESAFFCDREHDAKKELPGRLEFNPNKLTPRVQCLLRDFEADHASRVDVAIDYSDVPIGDFVWRRDRVKSNAWVGPGGVESMYLGSRGSDRYVRIYDKALEMRLGDLCLTRVEGMGRKHHALSRGLFSGVEGYHKVLSEGLSVSDAGKLALFLYHPEYLRSVDKKTLKRVKDMARDRQAQISPTPAEVYEDARDELVEMVQALQEGEAVRIADVYKQ